MSLVNLLVPKEIREESGLKPGQRVLYRVEGGKLMVEIILSVEEVEKLPKFTETSLEEFEKFTKEPEEETFKKLKTGVK